MVAYNFRPEFADAVSTGTKCTTIRKPRKTRHARVGERLQLYTGLRTKQARKLITPDPLCVSCDLIGITECGMTSPTLDLGTIANVPQDDGFADFEELRDWFKAAHGLPFYGYLIGWQPR